MKYSVNNTACISGHKWSFYAKTASGTVYYCGKVYVMFLTIETLVAHTELNLSCSS